MKKIVVFLLILILFSIVNILPAFADSDSVITNNEKAILNKISTNIYLNGKEYSLPDAYLDQIKKYLRTVDISKEQSDEIINQLDIGINIIKKDISSSTIVNGRIDLSKMPLAVKADLLQAFSGAIAPVGLKVITNDGKNYSIIEAESRTVIYTTSPIFKLTGAEQNQNSKIIVSIVLISTAFILVLFIIMKKFLIKDKDNFNRQAEFVPYNKADR